MNSFQNLFSNLYFLAILSTVITFIISTKMYLYPVIIHVSKKKMLMDEPVDRSAHKTMVPRLGGLGLFITFTLSLIIFGLVVNLKMFDFIQINSLIAAAIILVFLGVKDDLVLLAPKKKLIGQLVSVAIVIFLSDVRIKSLEGLLGVGELPYLVSVLFTFFVFILVINAFNLIDGIDGLAGTMAILACGAFGLFFLINGHNMMTLVSFILIGSLAGFLTYNFSTKRKIFMGDCGSMFVGFLMAYQGIRFLAYNATEIPANHLNNAPILLLAILSFPLLDTLRVFAIRIKEKRSPFSADRNHIHHRLLDIGLNHKKATMLLAICTLFNLLIAFCVSPLNIHLQLFLTVVVGSSLYLFPLLSVFDEEHAESVLIRANDSKRNAVKNLIVDGRVQKKMLPIENTKAAVVMKPTYNLESSKETEMDNSEEGRSETQKFISDRSAILKESIKSRKENTPT